SAKSGHIGRNFASHAAVSVAISKAAVKKALLPQKLCFPKTSAFPCVAAMSAPPLTKAANNGCSATHKDREREWNDERCGKSGADPGRGRRGRLLRHSLHFRDAFCGRARSDRG